MCENIEYVCGFRIIEVKVPVKQIADYLLRLLNDGWHSILALSMTTEIGDEWIDVCGQLALRVPSVLIPEETNILLNPNYLDFKK